MGFIDTGYRPHEIEQFKASLRTGDTLRIRLPIPSLGETTEIIRHCTYRVTGIYPHVVLLTRRTRRGKIIKVCADYIKLVRENPGLLKRDLPDLLDESLNERSETE